MHWLGPVERAKARPKFSVSFPTQRGITSGARDPPRSMLISLMVFAGKRDSQGCKTDFLVRPMSLLTPTDPYCIVLDAVFDRFGVTC